jgi:hypothetical protein
MTTLQDYMAIEALAIRAYGTSEGATKAWDTRGRGRLAKVTKKKPVTRTAASRTNLLKQYKSLGRQLEKVGAKLEDIKEVKSTAGKMMHFLKSIGEWIEPFTNLKDLVIAAGVTLWGVMHEVNAHAHGLHSVMLWVMTHIQPVVNHLNSAKASMGI